MPRSDLILSLIRAGTTGDQLLLQKAVEAMAAEERAKNHHVLAEQILKSLEKNGASQQRALLPVVACGDLFHELIPKRTLATLVLPEVVRRSCERLVEEQHRAELLRSYSLEPRNRVLLLGPPGNGKTSIAEALADAMMVPFLVVRYESLIGSYLGETATRLRKLFDAVRSRRCLVFFDEFDTLGKERGDQHDSGEIKRVVSSLLLQIDALPSYVVVVAATNHPELLDRAVWRRFQLRLTLPPPTRKQVAEWFAAHEGKLGVTGDAIVEQTLKIEFQSFSDLEEFSSDLLRRLVLGSAGADPKKIVREVVAEWIGRTARTPTRRG